MSDFIPSPIQHRGSMATVDISKIEKLTLFSDRSRAQLNELLEGAAHKSLRHRETLFRAGEDARSCVVVLSGALKLVKQTLSGEDVIVLFATPGEMVGALLMTNENVPYPVTTVAMGPSQVLEIPKRTFINCWTQDSAVMQRVNRILFSRLHEMHDQKLLSKAPLASKIAKQVVTLIERFPDQGGKTLPIPITRQEIADSLGASVESVIRVMSDWSQQGILKTSDQFIEIIRMDKIADIIKRQGS